MKVLSKWGMALLLVMGFAACSEKEEAVSGGENAGPDKVYFQLSIDIANGSRSATDTPDNGDYVTSEDGTEVGKDYENRVNEILLVFTESTTQSTAEEQTGKVENKYIASGKIYVTPSTDTENNYVVPIPSSLLEGRTNETVNVYVYCNPTEDMNAIAGLPADAQAVQNFVDKAYSLGSEEDGRGWKKENFLMSNAKKHQITFPDSWDSYQHGSSFDLGTIEVERSVARFDYKAERANNIYLVYDEPESDKNSNNPGVNIRLTEMALVNMSREFYYLRRVSADGKNPGAVCGVEIANNYVVDTDADYKAAFVCPTDEDGWAAKKAHFFYNLEDGLDAFQFKALSYFDSDDAVDENEWGKDEDKKKHGYKIWRYAVENTIPAADKQIAAISTGIVFRARIEAASDCPTGLKKTLENATENIYVYRDVLYGTWAQVKKAADQNLSSELGLAYQFVQQTITGDKTENVEEARKVGFTVYAPKNANGSGYYECLYYYWNRHNDNNRTTGDNHMGPMEFAVVRNNIYKLSVEAIYKFGYPEDTPIDPSTPDEPEKPVEDKDKIYFKMNVKVLPWVVRVNKIVFD